MKKPSITYCYFRIVVLSHEENNRLLLKRRYRSPFEVIGGDKVLCSTFYFSSEYAARLALNLRRPLVRLAANPRRRDAAGHMVVCVCIGKKNLCMSSTDNVVCGAGALHQVNVRAPYTVRQSGVRVRTTHTDDALLRWQCAICIFKLDKLMHTLYKLRYEVGIVRYKLDKVICQT